MTDLLHDTRLGAIQCFDFLLGCFVTVLPKFVVVTLELFNQPAYYNKIYTTLELITAIELVRFIGMGFIVHSFMVLVGELVILYFDPERTENKIEFAQCTYHFVEFEPPAKRHFLKSEIKRLRRLARLDPINRMTYYHEYLSIAAMFVFPQPILYGLKV